MGLDRVGEEKMEKTVDLDDDFASKLAAVEPVKTHDESDSEEDDPTPILTGDTKWDDEN